MAGIAQWETAMVNAVSRKVIPGQMPYYIAALHHAAALSAFLLSARRLEADAHKCITA